MKLGAFVEVSAPDTVSIISMWHSLEKALEDNFPNSKTRLVYATPDWVDEVSALKRRIAAMDHLTEEQRERLLRKFDLSGRLSSGTSEQEKQSG